mgnify:CR=1 FL=1
MRDPEDIRTKRGTSLVVIITRLLFAVYFITVAIVIARGHLPLTDSSWLAYLIILYYLAERFYAAFLKRRIDLGFAFPLLLAVYILNFVSIVLQAQEKLPLLNRVEHFASFVFVGYVIWVFFVQYLPQKVWRQHPYYTALLVLSVSALLGVANETVELFIDTIWHTTLVGLRYDTSLDLLMNTLGAGLFLAVRLILLTVENEVT